MARSGAGHAAEAERAARRCRSAPGREPAGAGDRAGPAVPPSAGLRGPARAAHHAVAARAGRRHPGDRPAAAHLAARPARLRTASAAHRGRPARRRRRDRGHLVRPALPREASRRGLLVRVQRQGPSPRPRPCRWTTPSSSRSSRSSPTSAASCRSTGSPRVSARASCAVPNGRRWTPSGPTRNTWRRLSGATAGHRRGPRGGALPRR